MWKPVFSQAAVDRRRPLLVFWLPVLFGLAVICCESTAMMGAAHTEAWLDRALVHLHARDAVSDLAATNTVLRKTGHFFGYGLLGLLFTRGWLSFVLRVSRPAWAVGRARAAGFGVCSVAIVASLDELHQSFLAGRTASGWDVLLDSCGAFALVGGYFTVQWVQRHRSLQAVQAFRALLQRGRRRRIFAESLRRPM